MYLIRSLVLAFKVYIPPEDGQRTLLKHVECKYQELETRYLRQATGTDRVILLL
jgi:hypothetical protein